MGHFLRVKKEDETTVYFSFVATETCFHCHFDCCDHQRNTVQRPFPTTLLPPTLWSENGRQAKLTFTQVSTKANESDRLDRRR